MVADAHAFVNAFFNLLKVIYGIDAARRRALDLGVEQRRAA
jgi:hypothetical protein